MKKKTSIILAVVLAVLLILGLGVVRPAVSSYNTLVTEREAVQGAQANVEAVLQRRADLIPNLVNTVKGYAAHEDSVYTAIADARAALAGAKTFEDKVDANNQMDSALSRLLVVVEQYPELKANENFKGLQDELTGAENRISIARQDYNKVVEAYNAKIQKFPAVIIARLFGFEKATYFEASDAAQQAPTVNF